MLFLKLNLSACTYSIVKYDSSSRSEIQKSRMGCRMLVFTGCSLVNKLQTEIIVATLYYKSLCTECIECRACFAGLGYIRYSTCVYEYSFMSLESICLPIIINVYKHKNHLQHHIQVSHSRSRISFVAVSGVMSEAIMLQPSCSNGLSDYTKHAQITGRHVHVLEHKRARNHMPPSMCQKTTKVRSCPHASY